MRRLSKKSIETLKGLLALAEDEDDGEISGLAQEVMIEACFLVASADSGLTGPEREHFVGVVEQVFGEHLDVEPAALIEMLAERLERDGEAGRCKMLGEMFGGTEASELPVLFAAAVAFEEHPMPGKPKTLERLRAALGVDGARD